MFFVSLTKPTREQEAAICRKGQSGGFNYGCPGASRDAPPLPQAARDEGWWAFDHERIKIGYGRKTYAQTRDLLRRWGQFQLPWATVDPGTPLAPGAPVCVAANVFGLWTAVPLQLLYKEESRWQADGSDDKRSSTTNSSSSSTRAAPRFSLPRPWRRGPRQHGGRAFSYAAGTTAGHYLAGEERFRVSWDAADDSVWYEIMTFSRPSHPLAFAGYPLVRCLQSAFRRQSARLVARAAAASTADRCVDAATRRRLEAAEAWGA